MFGKLKGKKSNSPAANPATGKRSPMMLPKPPLSPADDHIPVEDTYDEWIAPSGPSSPVYETSDEPQGQGAQEYEDIEPDSDIFGFDGKKSTTANQQNAAPSWSKKANTPSKQPPAPTMVVEDTYDGFDDQDGGAMEYEDVEAKGDIFGFDKKKPAANVPSWVKAPPVKGLPPTARPVSMQAPPLPKGIPPTARPVSMQNPNMSTYQNVASPKSNDPTTYQNVAAPNYQNIATRQQQQQKGAAVANYMNVSPSDDGGDSYEEVEALDLRKPLAPPPPPSDEYEEMDPDELDKKPTTTITTGGSSIAERQKQLEQQPKKEAPKKKGLAADYQKMKFDMVAKKFQEMGTTEEKSSLPPERKASDKKQWPPSQAGVSSPEKGTVGSMTRNFQGAKKAGGDKIAFKGFLWHKPPGRGKYHEEYCELEGNSLKLFRKKTDASPYFTIATTGCDLALAGEEWEKKNVFKLTAGSSRDYFSAFNATEMKGWMNALKPVTKQK